MKKLGLLLAGIFFLLLSLDAKVHGQPPADYFVGKWSVVVEGTPNGESKMTVKIERKDGKLVGTIIPKEGDEPIKIEKVEETEKVATVYFNASGYDVYLTMEKKDDDNVFGTVMGMFEAKGKRIKETVSK